MDTSRNILRVSNTFMPIDSKHQSPNRNDPSHETSGSAMMKTISSPSLAERVIIKYYWLFEHQLLF